MEDIPEQEHQPSWFHSFQVVRIWSGFLGTYYVSLFRFISVVSLFSCSNSFTFASRIRSKCMWVRPQHQSYECKSVGRVSNRKLTRRFDHIRKYETNLISTQSFWWDFWKKKKTMYFSGKNKAVEMKNKKKIQSFLKLFSAITHYSPYARQSSKHVSR